MKIAFVNQPWNTVTIPVEIGSIAIWNYEVARRLARDHDVVVYAKRDPGQPRLESDQGVEYRRFALTGDLWVQKLARRIPLDLVKSALGFQGPWYCREYILQIASDARRRKYDVIHVHNFSQFVPVVRAFNPSSKIVLHMHCEWLTQFRRGPVTRRIKKADGIVGCSGYITHTIRRAFPMQSCKCRAIENGVNLEDFVSPVAENKTGNKELTILFVGRVSPEKGVHVLLDAFRSVLEHHPTARLEIVGPLGAAPREFILDRMDDPKALALHPLFEGDYPASLQKALSPSVAERVSFVGPVPYREMAVRYGRAHLLVCPSVWNEPFGLPVVEAMACGLPVVATRSGGIQDIVRHEETGLLVERGNVEELAEAMTGLLADPTRRESMGRAGRARAVEQYSWDRVVRELAEYYGDLLRAN